MAEPNVYSVVPEPDSVRTIPWGIIFIMLYFCLPLGLFWLFQKLRKEPLRAVANGRAIILLGCFICFLGVVFIFAVFREIMTGNKAGMDWKMLFCSPIFFLLGAFVIYQGKKHALKAKVYERYRLLLEQFPEGSLDQLAEKYPASYQTVCSDLRSLLDGNFFPGCYLDVRRRKFVLPQPYAYAPYGTSPLPPNGNIVICPNCGASNIVEHPGKMCDYCRSVLEIS